jgi:hypothetical protein
MNDFQAFYDYLLTLPETREQFEARNPSKRVTLDRINTNGNYVPGNLRWATDQEQMRNQTTNIINIEIAKFIHNYKSIKTVIQIQKLILENFNKNINRNTIENVMYGYSWKIDTL